MGDIMTESQNILIPNPGEQRGFGGGKLKYNFYVLNCRFQKCIVFRKNISGRIKKQDVYAVG